MTYISIQVIIVRYLSIRTDIVLTYVFYSADENLK